jgi:hypothetical protein
MEAGTVPEKVTISHRGERYEIGMGKRYYAIWAVGAPRTEPLDRWPETPEGWSQAWARFTAIETPGNIAAVPRTSALSALRGVVGRAAAARGGAAGPDGGDASRPRRDAVIRLVAAAFLGIGVVLGVAGLFPGYFTGQSLASTSDQLVPHLLYLATWAVAGALVAGGKARTRIGALLGTGLSAVTFGLFVSDLATGMSEHAGVGAGMVISLIGWIACTVGSVAALRLRPSTGATAGPAISGPAVGAEADPTASAVGYGTSASGYGTSASGYGTPAPAYGVPVPPYGGGAYGSLTPTAARAGIFRRRKSDAGTIALLTLCAIGAAASFVPSWDSYTIVQSSTGSSATQTAGNAFQNPGTVMFGDIACVIAIIGVAFLAGLWRPARQGAALLAGVIVAMAGQAISALIQVSQPASPELFGISPAQAQASGLSVSSGVTSIFWVFCLFVVAMALACAWLITTPSVASSPGTASNPVQPNPDADYPAPGYQAEAQSPAAGEESDEDEESLTEDTVLTEDTALPGDTVSSETGHTDGPSSTSSEVSSL